MEYLQRGIDNSIFGTHKPEESTPLSTPDLDALPPEVAEKIKAQVPPVSKGYLFRREHIARLSGWWEYPLGSEGLWIYGPTGSGKTSVALEFFGHLGVPVCVVSCGKSTKLEKYLVRPVVRSVNGGTQIDYEPGPLALAMIYGYPVILDEGDRLDPKEASRLHAALDGNGVDVPELNTVIYPAEGFRVIVTANSSGGGDETGVYNAVLKQDLASSDRYIFMKVDYPDAAMDNALLEGAFGDDIPSEIRSILVKLAERVRQAFVGTDAGMKSAEALDVTISSRALLQTGHYLTLYAASAKDKGQDPVKLVLDMTVLPRATSETRDAIHKMVDLVSGG